MKFNRLTRVSALLCVVSAAAIAASAADPSVFLLFNGHATKIESAYGGWPTHDVIDNSPPSSIHKKHIGHSKWENIVLKSGLDWDPDFTDWLNESLRGVMHPRAITIGFEGTQHGERRTYNLRDCFPMRIQSPGFDTLNDECTLLETTIAVGDVDGDGLDLRMKVKEKGNRTKCQSNLRFGISEPGIPPKFFDVFASEPVETTLTPTDLDGDGAPDVVDVNVGDLVIYIPANQAGYFQDWMRQVELSPLEEKLKKFGLLEARIKNGPVVSAEFGGMFPISVAKMADGSVRVEFSPAQEQLKSAPRH